MRTTHPRPGRAAALFAAFGLLTLGATAAAAPAAGAPAKPPSAAAARPELATFAMGCFWCGETQFEGLKGVRSVVSGYTGGREQRPTYEQVSSGETSHYEAIQITFDPALTSYETLLEMFWHGIDPTQSDGQFCDRGKQYRAAVFVHDDRQRRLAEASRKAIQDSGVLRKPIVTEILAAGRFWPAEGYHQDFWKKDPVRYKTYRFGCGRDRRLDQVWGKDARRGSPRH